MPRIHKKLHPIPTLNPTFIPNFFITTHSKIPSIKPYFKQLNHITIAIKPLRNYFDHRTHLEITCPTPSHSNKNKTGILKFQSQNTSSKNHKNPLIKEYF